MESDASLKEPLAVFDVDGTLFRGGLLPALTRRLVNEEVFPERVREELSEDYYAWVERRGSYEIYDELVVQLFLRELKGASVAELRRCAKLEVEAHGRRLHIYTRDLAQWLKQAGYYLIAISGSPTDILETFLNPLGFDRAWARFWVRRKAATRGSCTITPSPISVGCLKDFWARQALTSTGRLVWGTLFLT
jgi:phosphoserine phosphatase